MALLAIAFFLSGAAALVYQVVWQRILTLHTGIGVVSVTLIVAAFMAGLGLGSQLGGVLSARVSPRLALRLFAAIEVAVGLFAAASGPLYHEGLGVLAAGLYRTTAGAALAHFLAFLPPTTLMGMSLPFLVRATVRDVRSASRVIGGLYGVNVLGASAGALLAPWVLVRYLGMEGAALAGSAANLVAAAAALAAGRREAEKGSATGAAPPPASAALPTPSGPPRPPRIRDLTPSGSLRLWTALYAASGLVALSLEVVWFRLVDVGAKSTAFTFGTVLCLYLLGLGAGSLAGGLRSVRLQRPLEAFLDYQLLLLALAGSAVALVAWLPPSLPVYRWFVDYWGHEPFFQLGADWNPGRLARLYGLLPLALFGAPTVLMGLSFGALQKAVVFLLARARAAGATRGLAGRALAVAIVLVALPSNDRLWKRLHGVTGDEPPSFIGEDASALSAIVPKSPSHWRVTVNGLPHSWLPYEGIHTLLGAVPALIHPAPEEIAVVGLGSGETAWAVACRKETRTLRVYEIAAAQPRLLREFSAVAPFAGLVELLSDPRVAMVAADGRRALAREDRRYDIVQVDAMFRTSAGSGNLYSVEFFRLCASRLKPGGLVCTQKPSRRVGLTFAEALPHALDFGNIVVGGNEPIAIDPAAWQARLARPEVARRFDPETIEGIRARLEEAQPARRNPGARIGLNHDLFPRDEFATPAGW
jgi:spermidine synthase